MDKLDILPVDMLNLEAKSVLFNMLDNSIKTNFSQILLATMEIYYRVYSNLKSFQVTPHQQFPAQDGGREKVRKSSNH